MQTRRHAVNIKHVQTHREGWNVSLSGPQRSSPRHTSPILSGPRRSSKGELLRERSLRGVCVSPGRAGTTRKAKGSAMASALTVCMAAIGPDRHGYDHEAQQVTEGGAHGNLHRSPYSQIMPTKKPHDSWGTKPPSCRG